MNTFGTVYLVGAGPGDPGLLTLRAKELIESADVVIYDRLVGDEILGMMPDRAKRIDVGKNAGSHPTPQEEIEKILLREASEHKSVVRLKGGDPFVFGRGGEEAEILAKENVRFEIIPGITSSIAAPAYAGIPVTHRNCASSLHIITGHGKNDSDVSIDYRALIRLGGTLVFMMSVASINAIAEGLVNSGMDPDTPAAVIQDGTLLTQRAFAGAIRELPNIIQREKVKSPAVVVVGDVCRLAENLNWRALRPLSGCRVLVTRPQNAAASFGAKLCDLGAAVKYYPCIKTSPLDFEISLGGLDWAIFTSAVGVNSFFTRLRKMGGDSRALAGIRLATVGDKTAAALMDHGICADFVPKVFDGQNLARELVSSGRIKSGENAALFRARDGGEDIADILRHAGANVLDIPVYETVLTANVPLEPDCTDCITFTSASCVSGFASINKPEAFKDALALCIGEQTEKAAKAAGFKTVTSDRADTESMIEKLMEVWSCK